MDNVANSFTGSELSDIIHNLNTSGHSGDVLLSLPKFKLETNLELVKTLEKVFSVRQTTVSSSNLVRGFHVCGVIIPFRISLGLFINLSSHFCIIKT